MIYDQENIFAKILRGEIPCDKIYEDKYIFVIIAHSLTGTPFLSKNLLTCLMVYFPE